MTIGDGAMTSAYAADGLTVLQGDVLDALPQLEAESVNCIVTSPPFWGLRTYSGCPPSVWGGDAGCEHEWRSAETRQERYTGRRRWQGFDKQASEGQTMRDFAPDTWSHGTTEDGGSTCARCGAWRGHYGLEPIPDCLAWARGEEPCARCYLCHTRTVLRLLRHVLRKDGVVFWDIDDSRSGSGRGMNGDGSAGKAGPKQSTNKGSILDMHDKTVEGGAIGRFWVKPPLGIPAKNLTLIPERVALAAQSEGWIIRSIAVIPTWMPESAQDRPTDAYRRVLILAKSGRYFWDALVVRQPLAESSLLRIQQPSLARQQGGEQQQGEPYQGSGNGNRAADMVRSLAQGDGAKNLPNIWSLPPSSSALPGSHFAAFAIEEPELCIKAACPERVCSVCGKPSVRIVGKSIRRPSPDRWVPDEVADQAGQDGYHEGGRTLGALAEIPTLGWTDCGHDAYGPGIVLDPFAGTGTTLVAARKLGRRAIGIEASPEFVAGMVERLRRGDKGLRDAHELKALGVEQAVLL